MEASQGRTKCAKYEGREVHKVQEVREVPDNDNKRTKEREVELTRELRNALDGNLRYGYILQLYKCVSTVCRPLGQGDSSAATSYSWVLHRELQKTQVYRSSWPRKACFAAIEEPDGTPFL